MVTDLPSRLAAVAVFRVMVSPSSCLLSASSEVSRRTVTSSFSTAVPVEVAFSLATITPSSLETLNLSVSRVLLSLSMRVGLEVMEEPSVIRV